jgi:peptidoglycan/xylan/chitin deacetylase (PgdA/CDA1 family)
MSTVRRSLAVLLPLCLGLSLAVGCSGSPTAAPPDSQAPSATATPDLTSSATPSATPPATSAAPTTTTTATTTRTPTKPPTTTKSTPPPPFPASLRGKDLTKVPTSSKIVALTFDAGANANQVASILATLKDKNVKGTFFLTGDFVNSFPDQSRQIVAAGHRVGNHTVNHPHLPTLTDAQVRAEVSDAATSIRAVTGKDPAPLFRFPYGDQNAHVITLVNDLGYVPIRWTVDSLGWMGANDPAYAGRNPAGADSVADRVFNARTPGEIVLMHVGSNPVDGSKLDSEALPNVIDRLRAEGYSFVTLDYLFG